jgi:hypothetical protein
MDSVQKHNMCTPKTYFPPSGMQLAPASVFIFPSSLQINVHTGVTDSEIRQLWKENLDTIHWTMME